MANIYETDRLLAEYLLFHYGTPEQVLPPDWTLTTTAVLDFPTRCAELATLLPGGRALDVGCAVGRASFELARVCEEVIGIDFSQRFIDAAETLRTTGELAFARLEEGARTTEMLARVPAGIDRARVKFEVGDAMNLRADLSAFDVVLAANLLCRLPEPLGFLARLPELVRPGGQLVITTPCTWMAEFTPREHWLGGEEASTLDGLRAALEPTFELIRTRDLPFLLREHARKFQLTIAQGSIWRRR